MAAVNPIQILIEAQNRAKAELDQAKKQIDALAGSAGSAGRSAKILQGNFADFGRGASAALSRGSPHAGARAPQGCTPAVRAAPARPGGGPRPPRGFPAPAPGPSLVP